MRLNVQKVMEILKNYMKKSKKNQSVKAPILYTPEFLWRNKFISVLEKWMSFFEGVVIRFTNSDE